MTTYSDSNESSLAFRGGYWVQRSLSDFDNVFPTITSFIVQVITFPLPLRYPVSNYSTEFGRFVLPISDFNHHHFKLLMSWPTFSALLMEAIAAL